MSSTNKFIELVAIKFLLILALVLLGLLFETYHRGIIVYDGIVQMNILADILFRSVLVSFMFTFVYSGLKLRIPKISWSRLFSQHVDNGKTLLWIEDIGDVFVILGLILVTIPVRPILQKTFIETNMKGFEVYFVRQDVLVSVLSLSIVAIPFIYFILKSQYTKSKYAQISLVVCVIVVVGVWNGLGNYNARVLESRASWITQNWDAQTQGAEKALNDAKTDKEKATAYYWLGVAENRKKNPSKAIEYQLQAVRLWPEYGAAYASLSSSYLMLFVDDKQDQNAEKSLEYAQKCITYSPKYAWCYQAMGNYEFYVNQNRLASIENYKKAVELDPGNRELKQSYENLIRGL